MESGIPTGSLFYFVIILVVVALLVLGLLFWLFGYGGTNVSDPMVPNPSADPVAETKSPEVISNPPVTKVVVESKTPEVATKTTPAEPTPVAGAGVTATPASIDSMPVLAVPVEPISGLSSVGPMFDIMGLA